MHGSFTILLSLIVSIFFFLFIEVMFIYSLVTFSETAILCPFSAKAIFKIFISFKYSHSYVWADVGWRFYLNVHYCQFTVYCGVLSFTNHKNDWNCSLLLRPERSFPYYYFRALWYIEYVGPDIWKFGSIMSTSKSGMGIICLSAKWYRCNAERQS